MSHYNKAFKNALHLAVHQKAEQLASEVDQDGLMNHIMQVEVEDELFDFTVDCSVSDYEFEEEANSQSFRVEVFCSATPMHEDEGLKYFMVMMFYSEILYKD
jgi:hypothetical protein